MQTKGLTGPSDECVKEVTPDFVPPHQKENSIFILLSSLCTHPLFIWSYFLLKFRVNERPKKIVLISFAACLSFKWTRSSLHASNSRFTFWCVMEVQASHTISWFIVYLFIEANWKRIVQGYRHMLFQVMWDRAVVASDWVSWCNRPAHCCVWTSGPLPEDRAG